MMSDELDSFCQSKHREELVCDRIGKCGVSQRLAPAGLLLAQKKMRSSRGPDFKMLPLPLIIMF